MQYALIGLRAQLAHNFSIAGHPSFFSDIPIYRYCASLSDRCPTHYLTEMPVNKPRSSPRYQRYVSSQNKLALPLYDTHCTNIQIMGCAIVPLSCACGHVKLFNAVESLPYFFGCRQCGTLGWLAALAWAQQAWEPLPLTGSTCWISPWLHLQAMGALPLHWRRAS